MNKNERLKFARIQLGVSSGDFARRAGVDPRNYSSIESGKRTVGERVLRDICAVFPLNMEWIVSGEGEMFRETSTTKNNNTNPHTIPLIPISRQADSIDNIPTAECEQIISPIKSAELAITISGDSMAPEFPSGSQLLLKRINERAFIDWGRTYALDTCNGTIIKRLMPSDIDGNHLKCLSINTNYPPLEINNKDIYAIYRVLMCMTLK